ncbi:uncharacterized protein [Paramormyrops kingsleyae]|uniref:uncharacterized protein n=1 Tax=Paramormyrops kingsleyae TaxID=1676925 RepID=UPI003B9761F0
MFFFISLTAPGVHCMEKQSHFTFHVILTGMSPEKSPEDCWAVLRAAKNDFLAVLGKVYPEEMPLECAECCLVLYYLEATVILKHLQPPGVVEHMTVQEWMTRSTSEADHTVIVVKEHKTSAQQAATFALSSEKETIQEARPENQPAKPHTAEWVLLKVIKRKWSEPRWTGPFQVTERMSHAVRLKGKGDTWFHWSQCAAAEDPGRTTAEIQEALREGIQSVSSAELDATQVSTEGAE